MQTRHPKPTLIVVLALITGLLIQTGSASLGATGVQTAAPAAARAIYLPLVAQSPGAPAIAFISPAEGATVSGTSIVAVQPADARAVSRVSFRAGALDLGTDSTPADGFQVFLDAGMLPAGPIQLSAVATGAGGSVTRSVGVTVTPQPPASATLGPSGATLGTTRGSRIVVPAGAAEGAPTISIAEQTQAEVTQQQGIKWDDINVTFLGAITAQSSAPLTKPLAVSVVGYGNRVQPGQAVVTYEILPDRDGDGAGELVVVNGANLAPNGALVSSPVNQIAVTSIARRTRAGVAVAQASGLSGRAGTLLTVRGSGFNPIAARGNVAIFRSSVDGSALPTLGIVSPDPDTSAAQILSFLIPPITEGPATLTLLNESTGATLGPIALTIEAPASLASPPAAVISQYLAETLAYMDQLPTSSADQEASLVRAAEALGKARRHFQELIAGGVPVAIEPALRAVAQMIAGTDIYKASAARAAGGVAPSGYTADTAIPDVLAVEGAVAGIIGGAGGLIGFAAAAGAAAPPLAVALGTFAAFMAIAVAVVTITFYTCKFIGGGSCFDEPAQPAGTPPGGAVCTPTQTAGAVGSTQLRAAVSGDAAPAQTGAAGPTGMGSALPPGGNGCGNIGGDSDLTGVFGRLGAPRAGDLGGRYVIKVYGLGTSSGRSLSAFTGITDPAGYFFVPLIPAGEPFTAVALDTRTGERRTADGVGPPVGQSTLFNFSFVGDGGPPPGYSAAIPRPATASQAEFGEQLSLALDERDDPMVAYVWADVNNDGDGADTGLFFTRWDRGGRRWRQPVQVATLGTIYNPRGSDQVALARDPADGTLGVAYTAGGIGATQRVWLARSADGGATWAAEQVSDNSHGASTHPGLALRNGTTHVAYRTIGGVYYATRAATSGPFSFAKAPGLPGLSGYSEAPVSMALDANGQPALVYGQSEGNTASALTFWRPGLGAAIKVAESTLVQPAQVSASLAFNGAAPRVAFHMRLAGPPAADERQLWFSASGDGANWGAPVRLRDGDATTFRTPSLALDTQGRAAVVASALSNTGGQCGAPKLARSSDLASWAVCSPDTFTITGGDENYVSGRFTSDNRLVLAFQFTGNAQLAPGVVLWREP